MKPRILFRSIEEPIREPTKEEHYESGLANKLVATWHIARRNAERYRSRGELHLLENGFKKETATYLAAKQAHANQNLEIDLDEFDERGWRPGTFPDWAHKYFETAPSDDQPQFSSSGCSGNREEEQVQQTPGPVAHAPEPSHRSVEKPSDEREPAKISRPVAGALVAIDLMNILVRCFYVGQQSEVNGIRGMLGVIARIIKALQPAQIVFAGDGGHAHRDKLHPGYKAHRPERPELLQKQVDIVDQVIEAIGWSVIRKPGFEADDVLASIVSHHSNVIIVSTDKDLLQLLARGARVYHPFDGGKFIQHADVVEKMGVEPHQIADMLALAGDKSDGIPGVPGIGQVKAAALLKEFEDLDTILAQAMLDTAIKGKIRELLREHRNAATMSRELATLVNDLHVVDALASLRSVRELRSTWRESLQRFKLPAAVREIESAIASSSETPSVPKARQKPLFV